MKCVTPDTFNTERYRTTASSASCRKVINQNFTT